MAAAIAAEKKNPDFIMVGTLEIKCAITALDREI